jgi:hypothetical protein
MPKFSHDRAIEELEVVALGAAHADVAAALRTHATGCEECRRELDQLSIIFADMTDLFPDRQLNRGRSAGIRSRLLARAGADTDAAAKRRMAAAAVAGSAAGPEREPRASVAERTIVAPRHRHTTPFEERRATVSGEHVLRPALPAAFALRAWAVVATVGLVAALAVLLLGGEDEAGGFAGEGERAEDATARVDSLESALRERDTALEVLAAPAVRIVSLTNRAAGGRPLARMFWDPRTHRWTLFVYELRPPRAGRTYQVWLGLPDRRIPIATFAPDANGRGVVAATQEIPPGALRTVTVTEEPAGGSQQPSGSVMLAGSAGS